MQRFHKMVRQSGGPQFHPRKKLVTTTAAATTTTTSLNQASSLTTRPDCSEAAPGSVSFLPSSHSCVDSADIHAAAMGDLPTKEIIYIILHTVGSADGGRRTWFKKRRIHVNQPQFRTSSIFPGTRLHQHLTSAHDNVWTISPWTLQKFENCEAEKRFWDWNPQGLGYENLRFLALQRVFQSMFFH